MAGHESVEDTLLTRLKAWIKQEEPVLATSVTGATFAAVGTFLTAHDLTDANTLVQAAEPTAAAFVLVVIGLVFRSFVDSPSTAVKKATTTAPPTTT